MASWSEFQATAPEMAAAGERELFRSGSGDGLLTTIAGEGLPRTHPVNVGIVDGRLMTFVQGHSAKARDLLTDGRYALHAHLDPNRPNEFLLRGRGTVVTDATTRAKALVSWPFSPDDSYPLLELDIEHALFGDRADPDAWPPVYTSWRPLGVSSRSARPPALAEDLTTCHSSIRVHDYTTARGHDDTPEG